MCQALNCFTLISGFTPGLSFLYFFLKIFIYLFDGELERTQADGGAGGSIPELKAYAAPTEPPGSPHTRAFKHYAALW